MRRILLVAGLVLLAGCIAMAQEVPTAELYLGYTFIRVNSAANVNAFTTNGGLGAIQFNFNKNFGFVAEFGGTSNGTISAFGPNRSVSQTQFTYLFGPRVFVNKAGRIEPFFEYLLGGIHNSRSFAVANSLLPTPLIVPRGVTVTVNPANTRFATSQNAFAMAIGGGMDVKLGNKISFRPIQLDYLPSHFSPLNIPGVPGTFNNTRWQNNLRYSAGVSFRFGSKPGM